MRTLGAALMARSLRPRAGCGVGGDEGGTGARAINWYAFNEPGGSYDQAVADCNKQANGRYKINYVKLPNIADQQRELLVRRLAAEDDSIDLASLDVIWTAEFAEAGWILPWEGERRSATEEGKLEGPLKTVDYQGKIWAIPHTSNTQLLWYRKDRVDAPPDDFTWDEMIDDAVEKGTAVEVQAAQYEGLVVWINALIASAGGQIVNEQGDVLVNDTAKRAAEIESKLANSPAAPPGMSTANEDAGRLGFESGRSDYMVNYPYIYPAAAEVGEDLQKNIGWARYPRTVQGQAEPAAARRLQHRRVGVLEQPGPRLRGGRVHRQPGEPGAQRRAGRPAAHHRVGLRRPEGPEGVPVRRRAAGVDRRRGAAAGDAGLQRHLARDPEDLSPTRRGGSRQDRGHSCATGSRRPSTGRSSDGSRHRPELPAAAPPPKKKRNDRARPGRAQARLDAVRARGDRDAARDRLSDRVRVLPVAAEVRPALPRRQGVRGARQLRRRAHLDDLVDGRRHHADHHGGLGGHRARARHADRAGHAPRDLRPRPGARGDPDPLRHRHRRRGVRLEVRLRPDQRLRLRAAARPGRLAAAHHAGRARSS